MDATLVPTPVIGDLAERLMLGGLHAVACHGLDCERVHDVFEDTEVRLDADGRLDRHADAVIVATWHDGEPFADTLFSFAMFRPHETVSDPGGAHGGAGRPAGPGARQIHRWLPVFCARR